MLATGLVSTHDTLYVLILVSPLRRASRLCARRLRSRRRAYLQFPSRRSSQATAAAHVVGGGGGCRRDGPVEAVQAAPLVPPPPGTAGRRTDERHAPGEAELQRVDV